MNWILKPAGYGQDHSYPKAKEGMLTVMENLSNAEDHSWIWLQLPRLGQSLLEKLNIPCNKSSHAIND